MKRLSIRAIVLSGLIVLIGGISICVCGYSVARNAVKTGESLKATNPNEIRRVMIREDSGKGLMGSHTEYEVPVDEPLLKEFLKDVLPQGRYDPYPGARRYISIRIETNRTQFTGDIHYDRRYPVAIISVRGSRFGMWTGRSEALARLLSKYLPLAPPIQ